MIGVKKNVIVFFGLFLIGMLFVPTGIPFMDPIPEAEAAGYDVMISSSGFSVTSLNIEMNDTITFMSTTSFNWIIKSESLLGGQHVIDSEGDTWLGYGIGIILLNIGMYFVASAVMIMKIRKL